MVERNKLLSEASRSVEDLYTERLVRHLSGQRLHGNRIKLPATEWEELAERFPPFRDNLHELGIAITGAEVGRDASSLGLPDTESYRQLYFPYEGEDSRVGSYFLADLLQYRVSEASGRPIIPAQEAHHLLVEYGFEKGLLTPTSRHSVSVYNITRSILEGFVTLFPYTVS